MESAIFGSALANSLNDVATRFHVGNCADSKTTLAELHLSNTSTCGGSVVAQCLMENSQVVGTYYKDKLLCQDRTNVSEMIDKLCKISVTMQGLLPSLTALSAELAIAFNASALLLRQMNRSEPDGGSLNRTDPAAGPMSTAWSRIQKVTIATWHRVLCVMSVPESRPDIETLLVRITGIAHLAPAEVISLITLQCCVLSLGHMITRQRSNARSILEDVLKMNPRRNLDGGQGIFYSAILMGIPLCDLTVELCGKDNNSLLDARGLAGLLLAACQFQTGQWDDCLYRITNTQSDLPESLKLIQTFIQGFCLFQTGNCKSAMKALTSLAESPGIDDALKVKTVNLIGCCLATLNKPYTAIQKFQQALKMNFSLLCPLYNISIVFRCLGLQDAEIEALHLLIDAVRDTQPSTTPLEFDTIVGSLPTNALNHPGDGYIIDERGVNVCFVMYTLAKRCLEMGRFSDASKKYGELLRVIEDNLSPSTKHPMDSREDSCLPPLRTILLEVALSFYKANDVERSLATTDRILTKMVPEVANTTETSDTREPTDHLQTDRDVLPRSSRHGSGFGDGEVDVRVALPSSGQDEPSQTGGSELTVPQRSSDIPFRPPDVSVNIARGRPVGETESSRESDARLFVAHTLLLKSNCLIQTKNWAQAWAISRALLGYLSGVSRIGDPCEEVGSRSREARFKTEGGGDEMTPRSKKRKLEPTHEVARGETNSQQPIRESLLEVKAKAYNNKAMILIGQKKTSEALHMLVLGTQCNPDDSDVLYNYILLLTTMGRLGEARKLLKQLVVLDADLTTSPLSQFLTSHN